MTEKLQADYEAARAARKAIEKELEQLPAEIASAISSGNGPELIRLRQIEIELPARFAGASKLETAAREAWLEAEGARATEALGQAETALYEIQNDRAEKEAAFVLEIERLTQAEAAAHVQFNATKNYFNGLKARLLEGRGGERRAINRVLAANQ